jgi:hypothetical protein
VISAEHGRFGAGGEPLGVRVEQDADEDGPVGFVFDPPRLALTVDPELFG